MDETDVTNFVIAGVLSQYDNDSLRYSITYLSRKHSPAENNYKIYDKVLLTTVHAFQEW
jgi:hypothetical protein